MSITKLEPLPERQPPKNSEDDLALRFTARHGDELRYVAKWGRWMIYSAGRWQPDERMQVFDWARAICREAATASENPKFATAKTRAAVESLARSDPRHSVSADVWDADPWLLNTPTGTIDLQTGDISPHRRADHLTKITAATPSGGCPRWKEFLKRTTAGNVELETFLQRMVGYSFTGSTREHALFHLYGTGANGKSVFVNTVSGILGDYHRTAPVDVFMATNSDRHPTELAMLRGARLVTAVETEEGRRWAESRIKALTGGDPIAARFMRQDFFEFTPVFKLVITGNNKPHLRNVDEAIRRRLHLVPFKVTIPPEERDPELSDKLKEEWPGILEWAIDGALDWHENGLAPPEIVRAATEDYLSAEDCMAAWMEDSCSIGETFVAPVAALFLSWRDWCDRAGEHPGSQKRFGQNLEARGFKRCRQAHTGTRQFRGICPRSDQGDTW